MPTKPQTAFAKPVEILLAEDDPADVELVLQATKEFKILNNISVVSNGEELLKCLRKEGEYKNHPTPDLILLDLNMPKKGGREALAEIRADKALTHLPVVIMTCSDNEMDVVKSYELHANCYVKKPLQMAAFEKVVRDLEYFWFSIVTLPTRLPR